MAQPTKLIYSFGTFRLDPQRRVLLQGNGQPVPLTPKSFETLLYFVEHNGEVLDKQTLMSAIWPDTVVEESNLSQNVYTLRRALGDDRGGYRYILTVPGVGYRFLPEVQRIAGPEEVLHGISVTEPAAQQAAQLPAKPERSGAGHRRIAGAVLITLAICVAILAGWWMREHRAPAPVMSIAVLPFKPVVVDDRNEALELGMADSLIGKLSSIRHVTVRPLSAVRRFGGPEQDPLDAGRQLGVDAVLDGHIQTSGDRLRITTRLVRVSDEKQLWLGEFEENFIHIFAVQDTISSKVVRELALSLSGEERQLMTKQHTASAEAYASYLKGRLFWNDRTPEGTARAIHYFGRALEQDPQYALAYAGLADAYRGIPIRSELPSREPFRKAKQAALRALEIDGSLAEAHTALGWILLFHDWDWERAQREYARALHISPNDALAHLGHAHLLSVLGRHDEALRAADNASNSEPLSPHIGALKGMFLFHARRYPEAVEQLHETLEIEPDFWIAETVLGHAYEAQGRHEEALEAFRQAGQFSGGTTHQTAMTGYTYAVSGRREQALQTLAELQAGTGAQRYVPPYNMALLYHGLGDRDETLSWLERGFDERDVRMIFLGVDPKWDRLREDPRFLDLLKRMNLL